jgi:hypothetical protein
MRWDTYDANSVTFNNRKMMMMMVMTMMTMKTGREGHIV